MLAWPLPAFGTLWRATVNGDKRILAIWDAGAQPYSIGDMLLFQEATLVMQRVHKASKVDLCMVTDPKHYKRADSRFEEITWENHLNYALALMRLAQVNPHLGSLMLFDSYGQLETFVADNPHVYHVWPPLGYYLSNEYLYYEMFDSIAHYYMSSGSIPHLTSLPSMKKWARAFIQRHIAPDIPIVVQIRQNPRIDRRRNSNIKCWIELFEYAQNRLPVKFIVVCSADEVDSRLRNRPNVVVAKDFCTTIEHDLALIESAALYMGGSSGTSIMALFSNVAYTIVNWPGDELLPDVGSSVVQEADCLRYLWASDVQRLILEKDTADVLIREVERFLGAVDLTAWKEERKAEEDGGRGTLRLW